MKTKILHLEPVYFFQRWPFQIYATRDYFNIPSLSLLQLAAYFPKITTVIDGIQDPTITPKKLFKILQEYNYANCIIGIGSHSSVSGLNTYYTLKMVKEYAPNATIIMDGYHATFFHTFWIKIGADIIFRHEADISYPNFVKEFERFWSIEKKFDENSLKGCTVSASWLEKINNHKKGLSKESEVKKNKFDLNKVMKAPVVINRQTPVIKENMALMKDLDSAPIPIRRTKNLHTHFLPLVGKGYASAIETARGCPFKCEFCSTAQMWKGTQRYKSADRAFEELESAVNMGITKFLFVDESWGVNRAIMMELLNKIKQSGMKIQFIIQIRVDTIIKNPDMIKLASECGLRAALVGYESLSQDVLNQSNKKTKVKTFYLARNILHEAGVLIFGFFLIGLPGESKKQTQLTLSHMYHLADFPFLQQYIPYFKGAYKKSIEKAEITVDMNTDLPKTSFFIIDTQFIHQMFTDKEDIKHIKDLIFKVRAKDRVMSIVHPTRIGEVLFARNQLEETRRRFLRQFYLSMIKNIINFHPNKLLNMLRGYAPKKR